MNKYKIMPSIFTHSLNIYLESVCSLAAGAIRCWVRRSDPEAQGFCSRGAYIYDQRAQTNKEIKKKRIFQKDNTYTKENEMMNHEWLRIRLAVSSGMVSLRRKLWDWGLNDQKEVLLQG